LGEYHFFQKLLKIKIFNIWCLKKTNPYPLIQSHELRHRAIRVLNEKYNKNKKYFFNDQTIKK